MAYVGLLGLKELFLAPNMNFELMKLQIYLFPGSGHGYHPWAAHGTILIDEPDSILKAVPLVAQRFSPFLARIESVAVYEFYPTRLIREVGTTIALPGTETAFSVLSEGRLLTTEDRFDPVFLACLALLSSRYEACHICCRRGLFFKKFAYVRARLMIRSNRELRRSCNKWYYCKYRSSTCVYGKTRKPQSESNCPAVRLQLVHPRTF